MVKEAELKILRDELRYLNSKGKQVRRRPRSIAGGFYFLEVFFEQILYSERLFIEAEALLNNEEAVVKSVRKLLVSKVLKLINLRGKHV